MLEEVNVDLSSYKIVLINPGIHVSTKDAFNNLRLEKPALSIKDIIKEPLKNWKDLLQNDFERSVFQQHPEILRIKNTLYQNGAIYASMTGTGSTVYGIFNKSEQPTFSFPKAYFQIWLK